MTLEDAFALVVNLGPASTPRRWVRLDCGADVLLSQGEPTLATFPAAEESAEHGATVRLQVYRLAGRIYGFGARREANGFVTVCLRERA
jgi:hypothetical protein